MQTSKPPKLLYTMKMADENHNDICKLGTHCIWDFIFHLMINVKKYIFQNSSESAQITRQILIVFKQNPKIKCLYNRNEIFSTGISKIVDFLFSCSVCVFVNFGTTNLRPFLICESMEFLIQCNQSADFQAILNNINVYTQMVKTKCIR